MSPRSPPPCPPCRRPPARWRSSSCSPRQGVHTRARRSWAGRIRRQSPPRGRPPRRQQPKRPSCRRLSRWRKTGGTMRFRPRCPSCASWCRSAPRRDACLPRRRSRRPCRADRCRCRRRRPPWQALPQAPWHTDRQGSRSQAAPPCPGGTGRGQKHPILPGTSRASRRRCAPSSGRSFQHTACRRTSSTAHCRRA